MRLSDQYPINTPQDIFEAAFEIFSAQGTDGRDLLELRAEEMRANGVEEDYRTCVALINAMDKLIEMEFRGPIH
ncbi:hypothetical protein [Oceanibacterium hippocampi]|uniref:Uncharacterized protein n=1 Tax=Oceanibacterium hippocampi TaxID=745714 RepID=A0A1Y5U2M9_9PROT|nr:hypothetical protein [Oceanibacterium hippocampi]SLN77412.1 hypothetical protein OCH7691_04405 [Oceanibacterium hippocampi]